MQVVNDIDEPTFNESQIVNNGEAAPVEYQPMEQIAHKVPWIDQLERYVNDALIGHIQLRNFDTPYYGFTCLTDKWKEYDRCYECRAKERENSDNKADYQGWSNVVLADFHARIEILKTRELNIIFGGTETFNSRATKYSNEEDAIFGKRLVHYSLNAVENQRRETEKILQDRLKYGTWFAYEPYKIREKKYEKVINYAIDDNGNPIIDANTGQFIPVEPYLAELISYEKFTDIEHLPMKNVYIHPKIEQLNDNEVVFVKIDKSNNELLEMEKDGNLAPGMAEFIIRHFDQQSGDPALDEAEDEQQPDDNNVMYDELKAHKLWLVYVRYNVPGGERGLFEGIYLNGAIKMCGLKKYLSEDIPIKKGHYIPIANYAYGIGVGDLMYATYMMKCARFNQVIDIQTLEIKGGGFKDSGLLPDFKDMKPGEFKDVVGLAAMLNTGGKPILTWNELRGAARAGTAWDVLPIIDKNIETGTGATDLLAGMPTNSQVDRTAAGIEQTIESGNERINAYLGNFGEDYYVDYANTAYKNYAKNLNLEEDLPKMFDIEELTYKDYKTGEVYDFRKKDILKDVTFHFLPVEKAIDAEKQLGKITRFMQLMMTIGQAVPQWGQMIVENADPAYFVNTIAKALDITDIDRMFPNYNPAAQLIQLKQQMQQMQLQMQAMAQGVAMTKQKLVDVKDETALNIINETEKEIMKAMQGETSGQS